MPLVRIDVRKKWSDSQKKEIIETIHSAMKESLKIPENDRNIRFREYTPDDFQVPPDKTGNYTLVEITIFAGRSLEAKRELYGRIVNGLNKIGIPEGDVFIVLHEVPLENWGIRGGVPASEVDLGFKVDI